MILVNLFQSDLKIMQLFNGKLLFNKIKKFIKVYINSFYFKYLFKIFILNIY